MIELFGVAASPQTTVQKRKRSASKVRSGYMPCFDAHSMSEREFGERETFVGEYREKLSSCVRFEVGKYSYVGLRECANLTTECQ